MTVRSGSRAVARVERRKLLAQRPVRVLVLLAGLGPFVFGLLLRLQPGTPGDALFGAWVHTSGFAVSLVALGFAGNWGFPLIGGVLGGDLFAAEDRHGTWKTLLTRSRTLGEVFLGKALAAAELTVALWLLLMVSSLLSGLLVTGAHGLVDLSGVSRSAGHLAWQTAVAWVLVLPAALGYTAVALLLSAVSRSGLVGVLGPIVVSLLGQLLALLGSGVIVHLALLNAAMDAWHGIFTAAPLSAEIALGLLAGAVWMLVPMGLAWRWLRRREPAIPVETRADWRGPVRTSLAALAILAGLAALTSVGPKGDTATRLARAFGPEFKRLTVLQQNILGHPIPAGARYTIVPACGRRGSRAPLGPGDWNCTMNVYVVIQGSQPLSDTPVSYDVSLQANGCFKAASPQLYVGQATIRGRVNPLVTIYGCFNLL